MRSFKVTGRVIDRVTQKGIKGLRVEAWDKDLLVNDMVGSAITGEGGVFRIQFDESYFKELFFDRRPDLFFKIYKGSKFIKSTESSILWNVEREDIEETIEVEEANGMTTAGNKTVFVRQRESEVFRFVTLRPFQRQNETTIEKKKVLCYRADQGSEFHRALIDAREHPPEGYGPREAVVAKAKEFVETEGSPFVRNIHDLSNPQAPRSSQYIGDKSSVGLLEEWIFSAGKPISYDDLLSEIKNAYKKENVKDIVQSSEFQADKDRLRDTIMALAIIPSHPHPHRDRLVNALRICRIIERIAEDDSDIKKLHGIDKAMKAPVVLPTDVFPLPPAKKEEIKPPSAQETQREEELRKLRERRDNLKTAIEELTHLRSDDYVTSPQPSIEPLPEIKLKKEDVRKLSDSARSLLKELKIDLTKETPADVVGKIHSEMGKAEEGRAAALRSAVEEILKLASAKLPKHKKRSAEKKMQAGKEWHPWTLKQEAIKRLNEKTIKIVQELGFDLSRDSVPTVVNVLQEELARVGLKLFKPPRKKRIIRYGRSKLEYLPGFEHQPRLPDFEIIRRPHTVGVVEPVGMGEYNSVRQALVRYEPREIAHIENVLRGEYKERVHRRLRRLEEEVTYEEERKATTEKDLQSTDRFELKREASETIKEDAKVEGGVTVKYDGPMVDVEAFAKGAYNYAKEQAKKTSVTYAKDVTQRSVSKVEEKVREVRVEKTIEEFEETNTHGIDNKDKPDHAIGIYRWVDKVYQMQVVNYGSRLFFDFVVPEPAAFYLYALTHKASPEGIEEPAPPLVTEYRLYDKVALRAHNGQYVCAEGGGGRELVANRDWIREWETFELIKLGDNKVALRAHNGQHVCAEEGGGRELVANRDWIREWETFEFITLMDNKVALRAHNGQYVCAEGGGGDGIFANRNHIGEWETFELELVEPAEYSERPLNPDDITEETYLGWVSLYGASGVEPPPRQYIAKGFSFSKSQKEGKVLTENLTIPISEGYMADRIVVTGVVWGCGGSYIDLYYTYHGVDTEWSRAIYIKHDISSLCSNGYCYIGDKNSEGEKSGIPISLVVHHPLYNSDTLYYLINVRLFSQRTDEALKKWQISTYEAIMQAYYKQKLDYEEKLAAAAIQEGISISGRNPGQNQEIIETELKKWAISMISGQHFELFNAMQTDSQGYPAINSAEAKEEGSYIQFLEQAFEWPLMTYIFYPYFWGNRKDPWEGGPTWIDKIINIQDVDPLFEQFLKAGAARVRVPVRQGEAWERAVMNFLATGEPWNGGERPGVDDPLYLYIEEEIQQKEGAYVEKSEGTVTVTPGSDAVEGKGTNFEETDVDREIFIEGKPYVIAEVNVAEQRLLLNEPYRGEKKEYARYYISAYKLVGGPWEVRIPTSLVYLQQDATLPDLSE